jgi:superoxide dismutase
MIALAPKIGKNKTLTSAELRVKLEKQFGSKPEFKSFIVDLFIW